MKEINKSSCSQTKIIAIHSGHNATVGLTIDGNLISLISEERINRKKNYLGFPIESLRFIKKEYLNNNFDCLTKIIFIDESAYALNSALKEEILIDSLTNYAWVNKINKIFFCNIYFFFKQLKIIFLLNFYFKIRAIKRDFILNIVSYKRKLINKLNAKYPDIKIDFNKSDFYNHHECHALTGFYFIEKLDLDYLIFTMDGEGEKLSSTVYSYNKLNKVIMKISENSKFNSVGFLYFFTTEYLGLKPLQHEFKVMGMSPYGNEKDVNRIYDKLKNLIYLDLNGNIISKVKGGLLRYELKLIYDYERFDNICGSAQKFLENITSEWIEFWIKKTGIKNIILSGGVFMNIKACQNILQSESINTLLVVPSASDESLVIGALWGANNKLDIKPSVIKSLYLGKNYEKELEEFLNKKKNNNKLENYSVTKFNNYQELNKIVAKLLSENEIVARACGREEWGARALGNRSIICNPSNINNIEKINKKIKSRDFWMPFSPTILDIDAKQYYRNIKNFNSNYMTCSFDSTELGKKDLSAAIHPWDKTLRPQVLTKEQNESYYDLILKFREITKVGALLNTSFNLHGEPNVSSYHDAIHTLNNSELEYLIIENYLLKKKYKK
jgi:carbamoyltransferase